MTTTVKIRVRIKRETMRVSKTLLLRKRKQILIFNENDQHIMNIVNNVKVKLNLILRRDYIISNGEKVRCE
jgi:hypothetical protein